MHDLVVALRTSFVHSTDPQNEGREDPSAFDWHDLGQHVAKFFRAVPGVTCMLGPLDAQPKVRVRAGRGGGAALWQLGSCASLAGGW